MRLSARALFAIVMVCLLFSGVAGLVYEVVWARYLALFLGHTSYAVVAVLVAFMGGLAIGNAWFGKVADRVSRPLACYAWLEIGIGAYAVAFPYYYQFCDSSFVRLARALEPGSGSLLALKFIFSLTTVLLPTVFMGGTLPFLTRLLTRRLGELRQKVAALYFMNSAGAVAGCWLADFSWVPAMGLDATLLAAAAMNLSVGALALFVSGWLREGRSATVPSLELEGVPLEAPSFAAEESYTRAELNLAVLAAGLSGFVAMLYQVAWTRLLALVLGSSTHAFSLMLMTFIGGIAAGSYVVYRWKNIRRPLTAFGWTEIALAASVGAMMCLYQYLPYWFSKLSTLLVRRMDSYPLYEFLQGLICLGVMFIPTFFMGVALPLASRVGTPEAAKAGSSVGRVFAVNTIGTVLGAALTGLCFMPWLGLARTFALGVGLNALIGLGLIGHSRWVRAKVLISAPLAAAVGLVFLGGAVFDRTWRPVFIMSLWRQDTAPPSWREFRRVALDDNLKYYRDGAGSTVTVQSPPHGATNNLFLKVNGKTDASTTGDMITQLMLGHLPMLLRPEARDALVIGLGSGVTAGAVACHPSLKHLDVVEISPEVRKAARLFADHNRRVLDDPRVRVVIEDAKSFMKITDRRYDVIVSEPSNPWMAGVAGVFTEEFYQSCKERMAPHGVMVQWVHAYDFSNEAFDIVLATFGQVFPRFGIWQAFARDILLVGTTDAFPVDLAALESRMNNPVVKADLARVQLTCVPLLLAQELISQDNGPSIAASDARVHSDFYPVLEYVAQRDFFARPLAERWRQLDETFSRRSPTLLVEYLKTRELGEDDYKAFAEYFFAEERQYVDLFYTVLMRWQKEHPDSLEPVRQTTRFNYLATPAELEVLRMAPDAERVMAQGPQHTQFLRKYGLFLMRRYHEQRSVLHQPSTEELEKVLARLIELDPENQRTYRAYLAELAWERGDDEQCLELGKLAFGAESGRQTAKFALDPSSPLRLAAFMAEILWRRGEYDEAAILCDEIIQANFLGSQSRGGALLFEATRRKILRSMASAVNQSRNTAPASASGGKSGP